MEATKPYPSCPPGSCVLTYRASLDVPRALAQRVARLLSTHRVLRGTRRSRRVRAASPKHSCCCASFVSTLPSPSWPATTTSASPLLTTTCTKPSGADFTSQHRLPRGALPPQSGCQHDRQCLDGFDGAGQKHGDKQGCAAHGAPHPEPNDSNRADLPGTFVCPGPGVGASRPRDSSSTAAEPESEAGLVGGRDPRCRRYFGVACARWKAWPAGERSHSVAIARRAASRGVLRCSPVAPSIAWSRARTVLRCR